MRIGVLSDTHGWLDPAIAAHFAAVDAILHAGDLGDRAIVAALERVAPVHAVRGNNDTAPALLDLPEHVDLMFAGTRLHLVHRPVDARPGDAAVVITGHTHKPLVERRAGVLHLNPGACGRRGFHRERTVALLTLAGGPPAAEIISLGPRRIAPPA
jgi:uncharacterized protein